ncbi:hypothetical protein [Burkholderia mayonis]|uniref:hypothetical protein n=1 Tax=Burkholderia mayonis TaxID=1385591 RepID=UPI000AA4B218|nr:hypothetical protein [Burkholderia mayonis]
MKVSRAREAQGLQPLESFGPYDMKAKRATDMWLAGVPLERIQVLWAGFRYSNRNPCEVSLTTHGRARSAANRRLIKRRKSRRNCNEFGELTECIRRDTRPSPYVIRLCKVSEARNRNPQVRGSSFRFATNIFEQNSMP